MPVIENNPYPPGLRVIREYDATINGTTVRVVYECRSSGRAHASPIVDFDANQRRAEESIEILKQWWSEVVKEMSGLSGTVATFPAGFINAHMFMMKSFFGNAAITPSRFLETRLDAPVTKPAPAVPALSLTEQVGSGRKIEL